MNIAISTFSSPNKSSSPISSPLLSSPQTNQINILIPLITNQTQLTPFGLSPASSTSPLPTTTETKPSTSANPASNSPHQVGPIQTPHQQRRHSNAPLPSPRLDPLRQLPHHYPQNFITHDILLNCLGLLAKARLERVGTSVPHNDNLKYQQDSAG